MIMKTKPRFSPGRLLSTPGTLDAMMDAQQSPMDFVNRHIHGDWGDICDDDRQVNEESLEHGLRLLSSYRTKTCVKLWVITEADRSVTTILLPDEY